MYEQCLAIPTATITVWQLINDGLKDRKENGDQRSLQQEVGEFNHEILGFLFAWANVQTVGYQSEYRGDNDSSYKPCRRREVQKISAVRGHLLSPCGAAGKRGKVQQVVSIE
jgi:hypothetical protein